MAKLEVGIKGLAKDRVTEANVASAFGSGMVDVYATPVMIGLMERAAQESVAAMLPEGETTVGISVDIRHLAATPIGMRVEARSVLQEVDGRRLVFRVEAYDEREKIGEGMHQRFIVNLDKFISRVNSK